LGRPRLRFIPTQNLFYKITYNITVQHFIKKTHLHRM
jgi:hypothetical protein